MNEEQLAQATLELLKRVDLKGAEVPTYVQINNWLNAKAGPPPQTETDENGDK